MTEQLVPPPEPRQSDDWLGTVISGKFRIVRLLGRGGMGCVYEAENLKLGRRVALKRILPAHASNNEIIGRFEIEARAAGSLQHENVLSVFDFEKAEDGTPYLVMELLKGRSLAALLKQVPFLDSRTAIDIIVQACRGLQQAHAAGIVHRDLKPANLYLCQRADGGDLVKVLDFGIAKLRTGPPDSENATRPGSLLGTPKYMSPEQARGDTEIDSRTDVYALGVILYEALSNQLPYPGENDAQILCRIQTAEPVPLSQHRPDLPSELCAVVEQVLSRDPKTRIASVEALEQALLDAMGRSSMGASVENATRATRVTTEPEDPPQFAPSPSSSLGPVGFNSDASGRVNRSGRNHRLELLASVVFLGTLLFMGFWRFTTPSPTNSSMPAAGAEVASAIPSGNADVIPSGLSSTETVHADVHDGQRAPTTTGSAASSGSGAAPLAVAPKTLAATAPVSHRSPGGASGKQKSSQSANPSTRTSDGQTSDKAESSEKDDPWGHPVF